MCHGDRGGSDTGARGPVTAMTGMRPKSTLLRIFSLPSCAAEPRLVNAARTRPDFIVERLGMFTPADQLIDRVA